MNARKRYEQAPAIYSRIPRPFIIPPHSSDGIYAAGLQVRACISALGFPGKLFRALVRAAASGPERSYSVRWDPQVPWGLSVTRSKSREGLTLAASGASKWIVFKMPPSPGSSSKLRSIEIVKSKVRFPVRNHLHCDANASILGANAHVTVRCPTDRCSEIIKFEESIGLPSQFIGGHWRLGSHRRDHGDVNAAPLHGLDH